MSKTQGRPGMSMPRSGAAPTPEDNSRTAMEALGGATGVSRYATPYQTAVVVHKPRDLDKVADAIVKEAALMGEDFLYSWRVKTKDKKKDEGDGKTTIEGMSIDGAMIMVRNFGNCALPTNLEEETPTHFLIRAEFIDLETGFTFPRLYRRRKANPLGEMENARAEDMAFSDAQSRAQRNAIDKAMPFWLKMKAIDAAKAQAAQKYADTARWVPLMIGALVHHGATEERIVARVGKPKEQWTPYDLLMLSLIGKSIKDKESTVDEEFPALEQAGAAQPPDSPPQPTVVPIDGEGRPVEQNPAQPKQHPAGSPAPPPPTWAAPQGQPSAGQAAPTAPVHTLDQWWEGVEFRKNAVADAKQDPARLHTAIDDLEQFAKGAPVDVKNNAEAFLRAVKAK